MYCEILKSYLNNDNSVHSRTKRQLTGIRLELEFLKAAYLDLSSSSFTQQTSQWIITLL